MPVAVLKKNLILPELKVAVEQRDTETRGSIVLLQDFPDFLQTSLVRSFEGIDVIYAGRSFQFVAWIRMLFSPLASLWKLTSEIVL